MSSDFENNHSKKDFNFLYEKLWQDGLSEMFSDAQAKEIAMELLIPDKIDGFAFAANYDKFLRRGMPTFDEFLFPNEAKSQTTSSIVEASNPLNYILSFPYWFIAAYPDVFMWFSNEQHKRVRNRKEDENIDDIMLALICEVFEINMEDKNLQKIVKDNSVDAKIKVKEMYYDSEGKWLPKWLKNLVSSYKRKTGKNLETSVEETNNSTIKEIYENVDVFASMVDSGIDNVTIIARKTTLYYLELLNNYRERFESETYLLAAAGVFDAQFYILVYKNIDISEIVELAEQVVATENDPLTEFIIGLEVKIFSVESPELTRDMIYSFCQEEKPRIHKEVARVRSEYIRDTFIAKEVKAFMNSPNFKQMRYQLGIAKKKWWKL